MKPIAESELVLNADGSVYHLHLRPEHLAETVITVGDPDRVADVSKHFDRITHRANHREFITHTGYLNNKHLTVLSTGIGTDNIDIVMNELDALANINLETREVKEAHTSLRIIRLGTSGSVNEEVEVNTVLVSETAIGMDGLLHFYEQQNTIHETVYLEAFAAYMKPHFKGAQPYITTASQELLHKFENYQRGTTITACGFYAPQGRSLRLKAEFENFIPVINAFRHKHFRITNLEMETAGIYGLGKLLGHECLSVNAILANRITQKFSSNPKAVVDSMIEEALEIITQ